MTVNIHAESAECVSAYLMGVCMCMGQSRQLYLLAWM